ncbi:hypothetical protein B0G93_10797 [Bacillus sp. V-88]|nr:hypothetical protein B1B00_09725 [Bacillus sp. DSM 27956]PRX76813.1 hypothetical protein B0G93_10797 [Bacillus sp. V-88]SLK22037.1 hypothetical protein SAMN06295884_10797 [Bacillus sp. V-88]
MTEFEQTQKYYSSKLILINDGEKEDPKEIMNKEKRLMDLELFEDDTLGAIKRNNCVVLDNVCTLKNLTAFAEITRYKETLLADMAKEERDEVTHQIINHLEEFEVKPIGYEIKENSIVLAWHLNSVISTSKFSLAKLLD